MATLYLDRKGLNVRLDGGSLTVYLDGALERRIPLNHIDRLVVTASTSLSTPLLVALASRGAAVVLMDMRRPSQAAILASPAGLDAARRVAQYRVFSDPGWRTGWARRLVAAKVRGQMRLLDVAAQERADQRQYLLAALTSLARIHQTLRSAEGLDPAALRGQEGAASAAYFRAYTKLFAPALGFSGRNRRPPRDPVNAVLSLGYTLVHVAAVREVRAAGLDPYLGYYHEPQYGRESLACDLVEPLRSGVDAWVWRAFRQRILRAEHFRTAQGACLLGKAGRAAFYQEFEPYLARAARNLRRMAAAVVRMLGGGTEAPQSADEGLIAEQEEVSDFYGGCDTEASLSE